VKRFFKENDKEPRKINRKDIKDYLDRLAQKDASGSTLNVNLNALKFLMCEILNKNFFVRIRFSKIPKTLPVVLDKQEIIRLFDAIRNEKQRLIVELMYSAGLRLSELINLKVKDIDLEKRIGWVRHGKGNKDRPFIIAEKMVEKLKDHISKYNLNFDSYIFTGWNGPMSKSYVQHIVRNAAKAAKIKKKVHPHTLRHSFATHLIENGYDVASVQPLLGHNSISTTMVYVHIAMPNMINVKSPLDSLY
jgi:site-specific recombinase XerD